MSGVALGREDMSISNNKILSLSLSPLRSQSESGVATPNVFRDWASNGMSEAAGCFICLGC